MKVMENLEEEEEAQKGTTKKAGTGPAKRTEKKREPKGTAKRRTAKGSRGSRKKGEEKTATDKVVEIIEKANRPLDVAALSEMTGYEQKKVRNIVSRAAKQGRINRAGRGLYVAG